MNRNPIIAGICVPLCYVLFHGWVFPDGDEACWQVGIWIVSVISLDLEDWAMAKRGDRKSQWPP